MSEESLNNNNSTEAKQKSSTIAKQITIFDFSENPIKATKPNSPRSLLALKRSHHLLEELYFLPFEDFKKNPDNIPVSSDIQRDRFNFYEENRQNKIKEVIKMRDDIINAGDFNQESTKKTSSLLNSKYNNQSSQSKHEPRNETAIENDRKEYERMKAKSELEVMAMIQYEVQRELMKQKAQEKERSDREKAEEYKSMLKQKHGIEESKRRAKEQEIQRHQQEEEEKRLLKEIERHRKENQKRKEAEDKERLRQRQIERNRLEVEEKSQVFQEKMNKRLEDNKNQVEERQKSFEKKEQERKRIVEAKRLKAQIESQRKQQEKQELIEKNQRNLEKQIEDIQQLYLQKQEKNEQKKKEFEEKQQRLIEEKLMKSQQKAEEIEQILQKNQHREEERISIYNQKQEERLVKKHQLEERLMLEREAKRMKKERKEQEAQENLKEKEIKNNKKLNQIIEKLEHKDSIVKSKQNELVKSQIKKREESVKYQILKQEKIARQSRQEEYKREEIEDGLYIKTEKVNEYQSQKRRIIEEKRMVQAEIAMKKAEYTKQFESLISRNKFDEKSIAALKEMFPLNNKIDEMIDEMKNGPKKKDIKARTVTGFSVKHSNNNGNDGNSKKNRMSIKTSVNISTNKGYDNDSSRKNIKSTNSTKPTNHSPALTKNETNKKRKNELPRVNEGIKGKSDLKEEERNKLNDNEINQKVNQYRVLMNNKLMKLIDYERHLEDLREEMMSKLTSKTEIKKMELEFGKERALASERIVRKNKEIEEKIRLYELELRKRQ